MTDAEVAADLRDTLDAVLAERLTMPALLQVAAGDRAASQASGDPGGPALARELAVLGLGGVSVPAHLGGIDVGDGLLAELFTVAGRRLLPHAVRQECLVLAPALAMASDAGDARAQTWLERYLSGRLDGAGAVVDLGEPVSPREISADDRIVRVRYWGGPAPEVIALVSATWFALVPGAALPATLRSKRSIDDGQPWWSITIDRTLLADAVVHEVDARRLVDRWQLAIFAELQGVAARVLELSLAYSTQRRQFGRAISDHQAVAHRLADMAVNAESAASAVARHVETMSVGDRDRLTDEQRVLRYWAPAMARRTCEDAIQVHGGTGFTWEYGLHLSYRRALIIQALFGGAEHAARRVGATLVARRQQSDEA